MLAAWCALAACAGPSSRPGNPPPGVGATATPAAATPAGPPAASTAERAPGTSAPAATEAKPASATDNATKVPEENRIYFASGASRIDADGLRKLQLHGARLKDDAKLVVTLVGHTDHLGSRSYNIAIAEQRTTAVASQLLAAGARRTQIRRYSMGNEKVAGGCRTAACRQQMRRVDLIYEE
ncbi:MAG TPA: OmpA family protein [Azospira sp.]|nr:OmpA family protein [Azospira sp.]